MNIWARLLWPNDEVFTATVLAEAGFVIRDANDFGRIIYTHDTFGYVSAIQGETFEECAMSSLIHHPVLWGADFERKRDALSRPPSLGLALRHKILRGIFVKRYHRYASLGRILAKLPAVTRS